jgi:hypothetical protein
MTGHMGMGGCTCPPLRGAVRTHALPPPTTRGSGGIRSGAPLQPGQPDLASNLGQAALALANLGARVFPCAPHGKVPVTRHGCRDATSDRAAIRAWWARWPTANIGLATGAGLLVLDVDPRHGGNGSLARLPALPATRETLTGGGGRHLFMRGRARCSAGRFGPGLDIRGDGGYVVVPPSVHPNGTIYRWHPDRGLAHRTVDAPDWLLDLLRPRTRPVRLLGPTLAHAPDLARRVNRARRYLSRFPGAISGQGGHAATWAAALSLVCGFELPVEVAFDLLASDFNPRCELPWSERELRHKVESADREAEVERGYLLRGPPQKTPQHRAGTASP